MRPEPSAEGLTPAERALHALQSGDELGLLWLRRRVESLAARRFAPWAWERIAEDFHADLRLSLAQTTRRDGWSFRSSAEIYVDSCIVNLCRRYFRVLGQLRGSLELDAADAELHAAQSDQLERVAAALDLHAVLAELPENCRKRLLGKYVEGLSMEQLAQREGVHEKTMRSRLFECRRRFRQIYEALQHPRRRGLSL